VDESEICGSAEITTTAATRKLAVFIHSLSRNYAINSQSDAKFNANGKREGDHGMATNRKLGRPTDGKVFRTYTHFLLDTEHVHIVLGSRGQALFVALAA
jgi:hypothetical protein